MARQRKLSAVLTVLRLFSHVYSPYHCLFPDLLANWNTLNFFLPFKPPPLLITNDEKGNIDPAELDYLMPWSDNLPEECRKPRRL